MTDMEKKVMVRLCTKILTETDLYETDKEVHNLVEWVSVSEQIKANNNEIRNLTGEYKKIEPECREDVLEAPYFHVISRKFRGRYMAEFKQLWQDGRLVFGGTSEKYRNHYAFQELMDACYKKEWVPHCKETFNGARRSALSASGITES